MNRTHSETNDPQGAHSDDAKLSPEADAALVAVLTGDDDNADLYNLQAAKKVAVFLTKDIDTDSQRCRRAEDRLGTLLNTAIDLHIDVERAQRALTLADPNSVRAQAALHYITKACTAGDEFITALCTATDMFAFTLPAATKHAPNR